VHSVGNLKKVYTMMHGHKIFRKYYMFVHVYMKQPITAFIRY